MNSLRRQLTWGLNGTLALLVGAALTALYFVVREELVDAFDATLRAKALAIRAQVRLDEGRVRFELPAELAKTYGAEKPRNFFELWDEARQSVARSPSLRDDHLPRPEKSVDGDFTNLELPTGRPGRALASVAAREKGGPLVALLVASDREDLEETLAALLAAVVGAGIGLLVAVWIVVALVLRRGLRPVDRLSEQMAQIDAESLSEPLRVRELPAELRPIGDRLNALLARLASSFERERRFSADLAHELRTPLTELRSLAECALKWPETREAATDREVLAIALQMEALVTTMLTLARGERGKIAAELTPVAIAEFVAEVAQPFVERVPARGLRLHLAVAPANVRADATLLRSILTNLLDNALAYAPAGSDVRLTGEAQGAGYVLRCANPAGDLTPADAPKLFERFWRKESSRTGGGEHVGLGLGLAQTLATAMAWRLGARLEDGWLVFTLETSGQ